jgi:hypothetical protein
MSSIWAKIHSLPSPLAFMYVPRPTSLFMRNLNAVGVVSPTIVPTDPLTIDLKDHHRILALPCATHSSKIFHFPHCHKPGFNRDLEV